ncbi:MAG: hypothetical protein GXY33_16575 [Phycisphaerae bacterium]|nr:hypothetical protein [Phycisphaerae bacterium]
MIKFSVFRDGQPAGDVDLQASYLVGPDDVPIRGQIAFADGAITCQKSTEDAAALAVMWEVPGCGRYLLQTTRLADRSEPYNLNLELARWRLMRISQKMEDWALFDFPHMEHIARQIQTARDLFIEALQKQGDPARVAVIADQSLKLSTEAGESLAKFHAHKMLGPRLQLGGLSRKLFGCRIDPDAAPETLTPDVISALNFIQLPLRWADVQPARNQFAFAKYDRWFELLVKNRVTIKLASVVRLDDHNLPPWLKKGNVDFDAIRDLVHEYLAHVAKRYGKYIRGWTIVSGIHGENYFSLSFDQILELTRLLALRAKQVCPRATTVVEILCPWGEYYAHNPRTIHPFLYADMVSQSGINFDAFGLRLPVGVPQLGMYMRDILQISAMIDRYAILGKPLHLTTAAPSQPVENNGKGAGGHWNAPWSPQIQARWLEMFYQIALSKPQVDSVTWDCLADDSDPQAVSHSGLLTADLQPKPAFAAMRELEKRLSEVKASLKSEPPK